MNKFLLVVCLMAVLAVQVFARIVPAAFIPVLKVPSGSISGQIIAGNVATLGQFPWQAGLYISKGSSNYICTGTLVHANWVLTAAHCTIGSSKVNVRLGSLEHSNGGTIYTVTGTNTNIFTHAKFSASTLANDVALIKIPTTANSTTINPINILPASVTSFSGNLTVSGFGRTCDAKTSTCEAGKVLNYVNVVPTNNTYCQGVYGKSVVTANTICTSGYNGGKESVCSGDSGGPLVQLNSNKKNYLVGVVSFGSATGCENKYPAGYMRANKFCDWMKTTAKVTICV